MGEQNNALDWKTVFKKILNGQEQSKEDKSSSIPDTLQESNSNSSFMAEQKKVQKSISSNSLLLSSSSRSGYDSSKDNVSKSKSVCNLTSKSTSVRELTLNTRQVNISTKVKREFSSKYKDVPVPEWNKAFKTILGKNSSVPDEQERKNSHNAVKKLENLQKQENVQKHNASVNTRYTSRKFQEVPKSEVDPEEEKVREFFALSRLFKLDYHNNVNEFEGTGVDIFKCGKKNFSLIKKTLNDAESTDESSEEDSVPLKGLVANNLRPYTTADLIASPKIYYSEKPWDDELLI